MAKRCVEIELDDETGMFEVSECEPKAELAEEGDAGMEAEEPGGQTFESAEEAMQAAMELLVQDTRSPEEAAQAGYDKRAAPVAARPKPQAVFGEGM